MEIFGHEFWSHDGKTIWYDLQTPRGEDFWLAGYNVETGERDLVSPAARRVVDSLQRDRGRQAVLRRWRRSGPGGASAKDGNGSTCSVPELIRNQGAQTTGLRAARRAPCRKAGEHGEAQYRLEPNVSFTPDQKWVVFRSNMFGPTYVFAVEVDKSGS